MSNDRVGLFQIGSLYKLKINDNENRILYKGRPYPYGAKDNPHTYTTNKDCLVLINIVAGNQYFILEFLLNGDHVHTPSFFRFNEDPLFEGVFVFEKIND